MEETVEMFLTPPVLASAGNWVPPIGWVAPFALLLLCIAGLPLVAPHFWHKNLNKAIVSLGLATPVLIYCLTEGVVGQLLHSLEEYVSFVILLGSLYTVSGGIRLTGDLRATPGVNATFLGVGAVLTNFLGTTGAAMLLIRPLLQTNQQREHKVHIVVFFIFLVANIGGSLTPLGDPPLYLGYLAGVPFTWTLSLFPQWLLAIMILLSLFHVLDKRMWARESNAAKALDTAQVKPLRLEGKVNFLFLAGIILAILFAPTPYREVVMVAMAIFSMAFSDKELRKANHFDFEPIIEVAVLFIGIFITMVPALALLRAKGEALGIDLPWEYFWGTGVLSGFLDNAPTYLAFTSVAQGMTGAENLLGLSVKYPELLAAISVGAVFMGALTYIGNGPNFMVRAIANAPGPYRVKMPEFFGYMGWSALFLLPTFGVVTLCFFLTGPWTLWLIGAIFASAAIYWLNESRTLLSQRSAGKPTT